MVHDGTDGQWLFEYGRRKNQQYKDRTGERALYTADVKTLIQHFTL